MKQHVPRGPGRPERADADEAAATHRSLLRGLAIIETVAAADQPLALAETARRLGLHRSTAHHLMQTLVAAGWLRQEPDTRGYALTSRLQQMTGERWSPTRLGEIAQPYLEELTRRTGEGTSVACWNDGLVSIVAKRDSDGLVRIVQDVGALRPLHCTAVGKAIAAWLPAERLRTALARTRLQRYTARTITTRAALDAELQRIRAVGYALDDEEMHEGLRCIAMPVFENGGEVVASMCVVGARSSMARDKLLALRAPLTALSRGLSERLGYAPGASTESKRRETR